MDQHPSMVQTDNFRIERNHEFLGVNIIPMSKDESCTVIIEDMRFRCRL